MRKLIIQQCLSVTEKFYAPFTDMMRLTYQRHAAYALAHSWDYWHIMGSIHLDMMGGGWDKIDLIGRGLEQYDFVTWIDADAAIMDMDANLEDALPEGKLFGAAKHDPEKSEHLKTFHVPAHCNIGVTFWRSSDITKQFIKEWFGSYPAPGRFMEQGVFNELIIKPEYAPHFQEVDDKYNATIDVNEVAKPVIKGWHGVWPMVKRLTMMRNELKKDFLNFRI